MYHGNPTVQCEHSLEGYMVSIISGPFALNVGLCALDVGEERFSPWEKEYSDV